MRKLVDAPRKKKQWTEKEEAYLQDKWGTVSIKGLSKALGRSEKGILKDRKLMDGVEFQELQPATNQ